MKLEVEQIGGNAKERLSPDLNAMQRLVDQLLLLAQIKAVQDNQIPRETLSLNEIGRDCVAALAPIVIRGGGSIEFEGGTEDVHVLGWREAISAAIRNLVENAVQASPPGSRIMVLAGPGAALQVRDEGAGVTPEQLEYLIRRNVRADHASGSGAGLGLAIVNQIMAAHGGFLQANPQLRQMALVFPPA
jgi:signal transduction histidine kinase